MAFLFSLRNFHPSAAERLDPSQGEKASLD